MIASIALVIIQPLFYDTFCTICLATAVISVFMIGPAMDEVLATLQHVRRQQLGGVPLLRAVLGAEAVPAPQAS